MDKGSTAKRGITPAFSYKKVMLGLILVMAIFLVLAINRNNFQNRSGFRSWIPARYDTFLNQRPSRVLRNRTRKVIHRVVSPSEEPNYCVKNSSLRYFSERKLISIKDQYTPPFLPQYKNPCWKKRRRAENDSHTIGCLPYAYLAGFPKSGTTDLHNRLTAHPLILPATFKEPHYITRLMYRTPPCGVPDSRKKGQASCYIDTYSERYFWKAASFISKNALRIPRGAAFSTEWYHVLETAIKDIDYPMITMDNSASTAWDNSNWRRLAENQGCQLPQALHCDLIKQINPDVRIIMIMRDPTSRVYSDYFYFNQRSATRERFHNLTVDFIDFFNKCKETSPIERCILLANNKKLRVHIGFYHIYIKDWLKRLPRDHLLFVHSETYRQEIVGELRKIYDFLGLPPLSDQALKYISELQERNTNNKKPDSMFPETKKLLDDFYAEHNRELADLLGDDRFLWKKKA